MGNNIRDIKSGDIVRHFKRQWCNPIELSNRKYLYEIIGIAEHTETSEKFVCYRAMYGDKKLYCRPYEMFMEKVDKEKYPEAMQEYRFDVINRQNV